MGTRESVLEATRTFVLEPWNVILLNDDLHTFDEVIYQVIKATGCGTAAASAVTMEAHTEGEAVCFTGPRERCEHVALVLREAALGARLEKCL